MGKSEENLIFSDEEDCPDVSITNLYVFKSIILMKLFILFCNSSLELAAYDFQVSIKKLCSNLSQTTKFAGEKFEPRANIMCIQFNKLEWITLLLLYYTAVVVSDLKK